MLKTEATVIMKWIHPLNQWHMLLKFTGKLLQEFHDCHSIDSMFKGLDKRKDNLYKITIERL